MSETMSPGEPRMELLHIADAVAREKAIDREDVIDAMEQAIQKAAGSLYGVDSDIQATISRKNGAVSIVRRTEIVEVIDDSTRQITLADAQKISPDLGLGDFLEDPLPPVDFGRIAAQTAKQVIVRRVREAERERQYEEFKDRVGEVINGTVKRVDYGNVTVDLGRGEASLRRDEILPREFHKPGDRVRAYIASVSQEQYGPQILLSRTHNDFLVKLFTQEVPEIYDGIITIRAAARDPGSRAKIAVSSRDSSIDPVGACVGMRGSRVQAVVGELMGEKIDIIPWSEDTATLVVNALAPAEVVKLVLDEDRKRLEAVVPDEQLSQAIGRRGQNVRLASQLTGWEIDILTEADESERRQKQTLKTSEDFMNALDVDEVIAHLLVADGFTSIDEIAAATPEELSEIEGFDIDIGAELQNRAETHIKKIEDTATKRLAEIGIEDDLRDIPELSLPHLVALAEEGVRNKTDVADLAGDELLEILGEDSMSLEEANDLIMKLRADWFEDDSAPETPSKETLEGAEDVPPQALS